MMKRWQIPRNSWHGIWRHNRHLVLDLSSKAINSAETNTLDTQLDLERDYQRLAGRSADYREGVSAFSAKRSPQFTGK